MFMTTLSKSIKNIRNARGIAGRSLRSCMVDIGIAAGAHHFVDLWARDSLFASLGANVSGSSAMSKKTIETFLRFQRADGLVPYLILRSKHGLGKYFGRHTYYKIPVAHFRSHMSFGVVPDGGLMTIIAARAYAEKVKDVRFLKRQYAKLVRALSWYEIRFNSGLITEWFQCEWADALLKSGNTLYTNVLYFRAASDLSWIAKRLGKSCDAVRFATRVNAIKKMLNEQLWNGTFFADWKDWKRQDYFATFPNMLAIIFGLTTKEQAESILVIAKARAWNGWTMENSAPKYPIWRVPFFHITIGMRDYHNGLIWLQPGILYTVALHMSGYHRDARTVLDGIAKKIIASGGVHEVYERNGQPVMRPVYRSEYPFAWSAGLFVWASHILVKSL